LTLRQIKVRGAYRPRPVTPLGLWESEGWIVKAYGITYQGGGEPRHEIVSAAKEIALAALPKPAQSDGRYGLGFAIVHEGQDACWLLLDWWTDECIIEQQMFSAPLDNPLAFEPVARPPVGCVWELAVHAFERDVWVETILTHPEKPDIDGYLARRLAGPV
jgi:hypothetical protein